MTREEQNSIFQNQTFLERLLQEMNQGQDWLLNYELGQANIPGEGHGTVYTESGRDKETGKEILYPTIMEGESGLEYFGDKSASIAKQKEYGIPFETIPKANEFGNLLSLLHELSGKEEVSYDIEGMLDRLKNNGK